uniref:Uncharacterized protein n=1 Tax=Quercus lobata TaxID=97700 RepID=A0A7N2R3C3_QUELO
MDKNVEKMQVRKNYRNLWHTDLMSTIRADTPFAYVLFDMQIVALQYGALLVLLTCYANELFIMICQDTHAVLVICHAVVGVEKVGALNFVFALRFSFALEIQ